MKQEWLGLFDSFVDRRLGYVVVIADLEAREKDIHPHHVNRCSDSEITGAP